MTRGNHRAGYRRRTAIFGALLVAGIAVGLAGTPVAVAAAGADTPGPPSADGVQPVIVDTRSSSDDCGELGFDHGIKIAGNGQVSSGDLTVTVTGYNSPTGFVDWSSTLPIHGVYVKGGPSGGDLFTYPAGDTGDQDLHTPQKSDGGFYNVSHVAFCWNDVPTQPDVVVAKSNDPAGSVDHGDAITYTLTVTNQGEGTATGVEVSDTLPAGVTFDAADAGCTESAGTVTCALGDIGPGAHVDVDVTVIVDEETCGTVSNHAVVSATNETGGATENDTSNEVTNDVECAEPTPPDVTVTKGSSADGVLADGDRFAYTITVTNVGGETATGVEVHDELPAGLDVLIAPLPSFQGAFCTVASSVVLPGLPVTTVDCGPASLGPGESATVTISVEVNGDVCGPITNVVDVEAANEPAANVGADNRAEASDEIACVAEISVVKGGPTLAHVGDTVGYVFVVSNPGGIDLTDIHLTDTKCDDAPALVDDGDGDATLSVGEAWTYECRHVVTVADGDPVHNVASVSGSHEGGTVSDSDAHDVNVIHPDIAIEKTASPTSGPAGTAIVYTYAVTNTGDTSLHDISVDDDVEGHIGDIASLAPGTTVELTHGITLGSSPITNLGTASGSDVLGLTVTASDDATVTVVSAGGGGDGNGTGGTPFTGSDSGALGALAAVLAGLGAIVIAATRRRREAADRPS